MEIGLIILIAVCFIVLYIIANWKHWTNPCVMGIGNRKSLSEEVQDR